MTRSNEKFVVIFEQEWPLACVDYGTDVLWFDAVVFFIFVFRHDLHRHSVSHSLARAAATRWVALSLGFCACLCGLILVCGKLWG